MSTTKSHEVLLANICDAVKAHLPESKCELKAKLGLKKAEDMTAINTDAVIFLVRLEMKCGEKKFRIEKGICSATEKKAEDLNAAFSP